MRVSADKDDPDYSPAATFLQIFLDGAEVRMCITADDVRGELLCYELDEKGLICIDLGAECARTVRLTGKVEIRVDPRAAPAERVLTAAQLVEKYRITE